METFLTSEQPDFKGNWEHLQAFLRLAASPIRTIEREKALIEWDEYKKRVQLDFFLSENGRENQPIRKSDYIQSLTAPAMDFTGAVFKDVCLGYVDLRGVRMDGVRFVHDLLSWTAMKGANFQSASLQHAKLPGCRLMNAIFQGANLAHADLTQADLENADLSYADLSNTILTGANLRNCNLSHANLNGADLCEANLSLANLVHASLVKTKLSGARIFGVSAWDLSMDEDESLRRDLIVTKEGEPEIRVDNIEVAQFVYLLLHNPKIRQVIDTVCKKGVLILGRFCQERKLVLDALRTELRKLGYLPMVFDFESSAERDFTETVLILAGMSSFIIADITNPKSSPLELQAIVPNYMVPLVPIFQEGEEPFAMFKDLHGKYKWVLKPLEYSNLEELMEVLVPAVIEPALEKRAEILTSKAREMETRKASDFKKG